ncbi:MAG TPA: hypothetical protein VE976_05130 [Actinomycetota bacterium]|jgi:hypothetical protein|nr:hypothetical protein [Actinomycetota bacterium]
MKELDADAAFDVAVRVVHDAADREVPLRLIGGQAVRLLTPDFPPRARSGQDMDFASVSSAKRRVIDFLGELGFLGDARFNLLHGDRQMYFTTPDGQTSVDVVMDKLNMCHVLEFKDRIDRMPYTLDVTDLLLSKLQVVEQNEKDVQDILYLLAGFPVHEGDEPGTIALGRLQKVLGDDWGWWRTSTGNLDRVVELGRGELARLVPAGAPQDPIEQAVALRTYVNEMPKTLRWKIRSKVGERMQWYELPEEVGH